MNKNKLINLILAFGILVGIFLASITIIMDTNFKSSVDWVAKVGDAEISRAKYMLQLEGLSSDKRNPLTQKEREYVLERMIEEELLIQRAMDLGMFSSNTMIRGTVVQQMIDFIIEDNSLISINEGELEEFYESNKGFFTSADKLWVRQIYFSDPETEKALFLANKAFKNLLNHESFDKVQETGSKTALLIPDTLMTLSKLREYIGPSLMQLASKLQPGEFTSPKKVPGGFKIIFLVDREDASPPKFNSVRDQVKAEFMKRRDDNSLRQYLENLKDWYDITRNLKD